MLLFIAIINKQLLERNHFEELASLSAKTVKKYERKGRVVPAGYVAGKRPKYNPDDIDKLLTKLTEVYHLKPAPNEL